jgi:hypothetical protein
MIRSETDITLQIIAQNILIAFCSGLFTLETVFLIDGEREFLVPLAVFFFTFAIYSVLRNKDITSYRPFIYAAITFAFAASYQTIGMYFLPLPGDNDDTNLSIASLYILSSLFIVVLYYPKSIYRKIKFEGLRQFTLGKPILIAYSWIVASVFLAVLYTPKGLADALLLIEKFLFILAISIASDIVDAERDQNLRTIPVTYGIQSAKKTILMIFIAQIICVLFTDYATYQKVIICSISLVTYFFIHRLTYGYKHRSILLLDSSVALRSLTIVLLAL